MSEKIENAKKLYLDGIKDGNYEKAVNAYTGERYTQHSTGVKDGKEGFIEFFSDFIKRCPVRDIQIKRALVDGQYVFLQAYQDINNGDALWVTTDFFDTDENDKIIEHWDVIAEHCKATPSGHSSVDGQSEIIDLDKTDENKELVKSLIKDAFMEDGNSDKLQNYISKEEFIEHNRDRKDGFEAFASFVEEKSLSYQEIFLMVGQGNFVATLSKARIKEEDSVQELCHVDIFRVENGKVVEHWDNSESIPEVNVNSGKF